MLFKQFSFKDEIWRKKDAKYTTKLFITLNPRIPSFDWVIFRLHVDSLYSSAQGWIHEEDSKSLPNFQNSNRLANLQSRQ